MITVNCYDFIMNNCCYCYYNTFATHRCFMPGKRWGQGRRSSKTIGFRRKHRFKPSAISRACSMKDPMPDVTARDTVPDVTVRDPVPDVAVREDGADAASSLE